MLQTFDYEYEYEHDAEDRLTAEVRTGGGELGRSSHGQGRAWRRRITVMNHRTP